MRIGLINVDSKIPPLPLAKLSAYHKAQGDTVFVYRTGDTADIIFACKVFKFTPDHAFPDNVQIIKCGTGYSLTDALGPEIENLCPDYDMFDYGVYKRNKTKLGEYALGFFSRGCFRRCPFCIVNEKEGAAHPVGDLYDFWRGQKYVRVLDSNLTALPEHFMLVTEQLIKEKVLVDFSQGLDIRLITSTMAQQLRRVRLWKRIHFAFDGLNTEVAVRHGIDILIKNGVSRYKLTFYVLVGYDTTEDEDLYRINLLRGLGVNPFVMPYNKADAYQMSLSRWVNNKAVFNSTDWANYDTRIRGKNKERTVDYGLPKSRVR